MTEKFSRKNDILAGLIAPVIISIAREHLESFGVVSLISVELTRDGSLLTCYLTSERDSDAIAKAFREYEGLIRETLRDAHILRILPRVHFRSPRLDAGKEVLGVIEELSKKYDLSA